MVQWSMIVEMAWVAWIAWAMLFCVEVHESVITIWFFNGSMPRTVATLPHNYCMKNTCTKIILSVPMNCIKSNCYVYFSDKNHYCQSIDEFFILLENVFKFTICNQMMSDFILLFDFLNLAQQWITQIVIYLSWKQHASFTWNYYLILLLRSFHLMQHGYFVETFSRINFSRRSRIFSPSFN